MANGENGGSNGIYAAIGKYGAATVIAVYLVWQQASYLPKLQEGNIALAAKVESLSKEHIQMREDLKVTNDKIEKLLRAICLIMANSPQDRQLCNQ